MAPRFDLILMMLRRDLPLIADHLPLLKVQLNPDRIRVITSSANLTSPEIARLRDQGCDILDEDEVVPGLNLPVVAHLIHQLGGDPGRAGWYFKQTLNLAYCSVASPFDYYLTWDADTLPLRPMEFFDAEGRVCYTRKTENHRPYFETIERLLGLKKVVDFSFICEHMMFEKAIGRELIAAILGDHSGDGFRFAQTILSAVDWKTSGFTGFAEYETYGTFAHAHHPDRVTFRNLPSLRKGTEFYDRRLPDRDLFALSRRYSWCSFETHHYPGLWPLAKRAVRRAVGLLWSVAAVMVHPIEYRAYRRRLRSPKP
jgi:hypothetical protein